MLFHSHQPATLRHSNNACEPTKRRTSQASTSLRRLNSIFGSCFLQWRQLPAAREPLATPRLPRSSLPPPANQFANQSNPPPLTSHTSDHRWSPACPTATFGHPRVKTSSAGKSNRTGDSDAAGSTPAMQTDSRQNKNIYVYKSIHIISNILYMYNIIIKLLY